MCTLTSVVRSQHAIGLTRKSIPRTSISEYNKAFRASCCVHSAHGVCVLHNTLVRYLVCLCVCGHKNEQFERNGAVYELYLLRTSQKSKNISFYIPHERERTSGSREKQTGIVCASLWDRLMYMGGARVGIPVIIGPRKMDPWYSVCFIMGLSYVRGWS